MAEAASHPLIRNLSSFYVVQVKPVFLVINKIDSEKQVSEASEFYRLGLDRIFPISAEHGRGITKLLDEIAISVPVPEENDEAAARNPGGNCGAPKCRQVHASEPDLSVRSAPMVSSVAGTTRDAVDSLVQHDGLTIRLWTPPAFDEKGKTELKAEKLSCRLWPAAIWSEAMSPFWSSMELKARQLWMPHIAGYAHEAGRSVIIAVNKWDAVQKTHRITADYETQIREKLKFVSFAPILFISAKTGQRVQKLYEIIDQVHKSTVCADPDQRSQRVFTPGTFWQEADYLRM